MTHFDFVEKARKVMIGEKFVPDFPHDVIAEIEKLQPDSTLTGTPTVKDMRALFWSSIDNTESRDLDQVEWAENLSNGDIRVLVGIADVDYLVQQNSKADCHARLNGTSVYTGGPIFPMLPEKLSTDLTSLRQDADRPAIVIGFVVAADGAVREEDVSRAVIRNQARLTYDHVGRWLEGKLPGPSENGSVPGLEDQLRLQREASERLIHFRKEHGALTLGGVESVPIFAGDQVKGFAVMQSNPARDIIESFMVAANVAMARFLRAKGSLSIRRVVRTPKRWDRIQAIAAEKGEQLPAVPDPRALSAFLAGQRQKDPTNFPELSLCVLKSLGAGEYIVEHPGAEHEGHFGLAVNDYTHSTAPNRRYADLVTQRLLKHVIDGGAPPFTETELGEIAAHCTDRDSAARHVERFMKKVAAAMLLSSRIGEDFDGIVTGVSSKGTFIRLLSVPAEGRIIRGEKQLDVGDKRRVRLLSVDVDQGFIDFGLE